MDIVIDDKISYVLLFVTVCLRCLRCSHMSHHIGEINGMHCLTFKHCNIYQSKTKTQKYSRLKY